MNIKRLYNDPLRAADWLTYDDEGARGQRGYLAVNEQGVVLFVPDDQPETKRAQG